MDTAAWVSLLVGFLIGVLASLLAGVRLSYLQFKHSTAGYRVRMVAQATPQIVEAAKSNRYAGMLRDKYRYSLGVILDELAQKYGEGEFPANGPWPMTVNPEGDRWERFDQYVRPVVEDINVYTFVSRFPFVFNWLYDRRLLDQLGKLTELCQQLETVVGELDAAFEGDQGVVHVQDGAIRPDSQGDAHMVSRLIEEHRKLHGIWMEWKTLVAD